MKITYWITTLILSLFLLWSSYSYIFSSSAIKGVKDLGFPDFFRIQLAILKLLAVLIILIPVISLQIKQWAYVGIILFFITAFIAHMAHKDPIIINLVNLVLIGLTITSYIYLHKIISLD
ncbi:DoxX family protein [uncultured Psychroserpens sp.]|uniref:DoxX family protein n=1 Tax=uncultured Psychroserpens sp. TaxID=255436 RepID=UPI00260CA43E|nr:DoxX family protein [uncultured Psychroserpens sp.]